MNVSCIRCGNEFERNHPWRRFCSVDCRASKRVAGGPCASTDKQYERLSGNWRAYFNKLRHKTKSRKDILSVDELLELLKQQNGKCALTGIELTCFAKKGIFFWTNASIDRKEAGGAYSLGNVQLVCTFVNRMRMQVPLDQFLQACCEIADQHRARNVKRAA